MASTKKEILDQALDLFSENGYHGTSMREIAAAVGIKGSSLYNHFEGKEAIFNQLFKELAPLDLKENKFQQKFKTDNLNPVEVLNFFGEVVLEEMRDQKKIKLLQMMLKENNNPVVQQKIKQRMESNIRRAAEFFTRLQQENKIISEPDPLFIANEFVSGLIYYRMRFLLFKFDSYQELAASSQKHIDFFWENIKKV